MKSRTRFVIVFSILLFSLFTSHAQTTTGADFTIIVLPDTQFYSANSPEVFAAQTRWIADNATSRNIRLVLGVGDIVNGGGQFDQWNNASAAITTLDGRVPYMLAIGNHDYNANDPQHRTPSATNFNRFFGPLRYSLAPSIWKGSAPINSNENFYGTITMGGRKFLVLVLEFYPRSSIVTWAKSVITANADKEVIIVTHSYLYWDASRVSRCDTFNAESYGMGADNDGEELWNNLVSRYKNVSVVVSGHVVKGAGESAIARRTDRGVNGNLVHQMVANFQALASGGDGFLRILKFRPSLNVIEVKTYSPFMNTFKTDAANQFTLTWHSAAAAVKGNVTGRLRNASTCSAIAGARVSWAGGSAITDATGTYTLAGLALGTHTITASANGYTTTSRNILVGAGTSASAKFFLSSVTAPPPDSSAKVTGHVLRAEDGKPLSGAIVSYKGGAAETNGQGEYTVTNIIPGTYVFTAGRNGFNTQSATITVGKGQTVSRTFSLTKAR